MNDTPETIDEAAVRLNITAPRVTPADLEANIVDTEIVKHVTKSGQVLRWAILTCRNGFACTGDPSAAVSPANDRAELGEKYAVENAKRALWRYMAYELCSLQAARALVQKDAEDLAAFLNLTDAEHRALGHEFNHARLEWMVPK